MHVPPLLQWDYYYATAVAIGAVAAVGAIVFGLTVWLRRRRWGPPTLLERITREASRADAANDDRQDHWLLPASLSGDRRQKARRLGKNVPIRVKTSPNPDFLETEEAFVLDRSPLGIGFASDRPFEVGMTLYVLPVAEMPDVPWIPVTVRNSRAKADYYLVGCEFKQALPWGVLLLFG
jgi:hypothetical protein